MDHTHCKHFGYRVRFTFADKQTVDRRTFKTRRGASNHAAKIMLEANAQGLALKASVLHVCLETEHERI